MKKNLNLVYVPDENRRTKNIAANICFTAKAIYVQFLQLSISSDNKEICQLFINFLELIMEIKYLNTFIIIINNRRMLIRVLVKDKVSLMHIGKH